MITITLVITEFSPGKVEVNANGHGAQATAREAELANMIRVAVGNAAKDLAKAGAVIVGNPSPPSTRN